MGDGQDTSGQVAMAGANEKVGMRSLDINEKQFEETKKLQEEYLSLIRENNVSDRAVKDMQLGLMGDEQRRRQEIFNPLEQGLVAEAKEFDSAARVSSEMGKADAAVVKAYTRAIDGASRDQLRMGVNPNSGKSLALRENAALGLASEAATQSTAAGERTKAKGFAMRMDAAGLGRNLATNQTAAADSALRAGQSQVNNMGAGINVGNEAMRTANQGYGVASSAFTNAGNLYGQASEAAFNSDPFNQLTKVAGYGFGQWAGGGFK